MIKKNTVEIKKRSDFAVLHNSLNEAIWRIAAATTEKRGMTQEETMKVFKGYYIHLLKEHKILFSVKILNFVLLE